MRKTISMTFSLIGLTAIALALSVTSQAQITINLPKFPKIKKEKSQPSSTTTTATERPSEPALTTSSSSTSASRQPEGGCNDSPVLRAHLKDLGETRQEAEEFTPGLRDYYVSTLSDRKNIYLEAALLTKVRANWLKTWPADSVNCVNAALDGLADAARKTIQGYFGPSGYTLGTPVEKKALLSGMENPSTGRVLRAGLKEASWLIDKNSFGLPTSRFKHGYLTIQYPEGDYGGLCWVFWMNLVQDYAGGGTYGASYGNYVGRTLAGCPKV